MVNIFAFADAWFTAAFIVPLITLGGNFLDQLMNAEVELDRKMDIQTLPEQAQDEIFDFIIVGGGSAGCVLANRLSENPWIKVLLLDVGGIPTQIQSLPIVAYAMNNQKSVDWAYRTVPQTHANRGLNYNVSHWPAGKTLGGSSSIHGMIDIRGNVQGFDTIAERTGDPIWRMKNILKYYRRVENYKGYYPNPRDHGFGGQMGIENQPTPPFANNLMRAANELGYRVRDPNANGPNTEGFAPIEYYQDNGRRADAYHSSLLPIMNLRPNLIIRKFSFVTKLRMTPDNIAYGVEYDRHGLHYFVRATKEVILCAGALSTPKILMLAGIGPSDHLTKMGIPTRLDLPVGLSLQDKYGGIVGPFQVPPGFGFNPNRDVNISSFMQWLATGKGMMGSGGTEATWVINSEQNKELGLSYYPDIHTYVLGTTPTRNGLHFFSTCINFNHRSVAFIEKSIGIGDAFFQFVSLNRAYGYGHVRLRNKNPYSPLIINPKYLQDPRDVRALVEGMRFSVKLVERTRAFQEIGARLFPIPFPGCEGVPFKSDEYFECLARHATVTAYKYCGTAAMGKDQSDPTAVVDSRFRVFGTKRLRVIDGSLFKISDVNTNDITIRMVAEVGAATLRNTWSL